MSDTVINERKSSNHFKVLFDFAPMGIIMTDSLGEILAINPFALQEYGYREDELLHQKIEMLIPPRFHSEHYTYRELYIKDPHIRTIGIDEELCALRRDGSEFPIEISMGYYADLGKKYIIAFISNISDRKKSGRDIKKLHDNLEATVTHRTEVLTKTMHELSLNKEELSTALEKEKELNELKSRFVSMASHEFRTPLSTVLSSAYLIRQYDTAEGQAAREKHLSRIVSSVDMLTDILNDFLSLGKMEEGKIQIKLSEFHIKDFITSVIKEIKGNLKLHQQIVFHHRGEDNLVMDPSLLKHILMNLISNASKFSSDSGRIEIKSLLDDGIYVLSVKDNGIGISQEDQKHLMERFFRGSNVGHIHGTGLGLHIISKYAELLNGVVTCKSELENGSEFLVTFKLKKNEKGENIID